MPLKAQKDYIFQKFGGAIAPLAPPWLCLWRPALGCVTIINSRCKKGRWCGQIISC